MKTERPHVRTDVKHDPAIYSHDNSRVIVPLDGLGLFLVETAPHCFLLTDRITIEALSAAERKGER